MCHGTCTGTVCGIEVYQENERLLPGERAADIL